MQEAELLLSNNLAYDATQLLEAHTAENSAVSAYEYLLGKAALASKRTSLAISSLESATRIEPDFYNAHFLLGKAYLQAGNLSQARYEFTFIFENSHSSGLKKASKRYLLAIKNVKQMTHIS